MISDLILIAKKFSVPSAYGRREGVRDFFAQYPDGVYIATDAGAPAGWEGYAVWFGGAGERYAERFMELIRDGYIVERFLRARVGGLLVFTFRCRLKMRRFGTLGKPNYYIDGDKYLNFTMPSGGTITLTKDGSPTPVTLEYLLEGSSTWTTWTESSNVRTLTLTAGQKVFIRNTSETSTGFSTSIGNRYVFSFSAHTEGGGNINSLLCKTPDNAVLTEGCFGYLFNTNNLYSSPSFPSTVLAPYCYRNTFFACNDLEIAPYLPAVNSVENCYRAMFYQAVKIREIKINLAEVSSSNCILSWLYSVSASGDFYCPASLTIPTGRSGIPSGWTRHDISELNQ